MNKHLDVNGQDFVEYIIMLAIALMMISGMMRL